MPVKEKEKPKYNKFHIALIVIVVLIVMVGIPIYMANKENDDLDNNLQSLTSCMLSKDVKMYGAWWCPHCNNQKTAFGKYWDVIKDKVYIECAKDDRSQTQECADAKILGYPTWRFNGQDIGGGEIDFGTLAQKIGCAWGG
jgi:glutaredoxin